MEPESDTVTATPTTTAATSTTATATPTVRSNTTAPTTPIAPTMCRIPCYPAVATRDEDGEVTIEIAAKVNTVQVEIRY